MAGNKKLIYMLAFLSIAACGPRYSLFPGGDPDSTFSLGPKFMRGLPQGNDSYSVGFREGCNTYMGFIGTGPLQLKGFKWDNNRMIEDPMYNRGFVDGRNHCTYFFHPAVS